MLNPHNPPASMNDPQFPAEEDHAPRTNATGEKLTFAQKSAILMDVAQNKRSEKEQVQKILDAKKKAALGIGKGKPVQELAASSSSDSEPASSSRAAGSGVKAVLALSPDKGGKAKDDSSAAAGGSGVKAALALKEQASGKAKAGGGFKSAAGGKGKKGGGKKKVGLLAKEEAEEEEEAPAAAESLTAVLVETEADREARLNREEDEREVCRWRPWANSLVQPGSRLSSPCSALFSVRALSAGRGLESRSRQAERERRYKEREEQRREIEWEIIQEERRVREKERKKREKLLAEKKLQKAFRDAAYEGDVGVIRSTIKLWCDECFGEFGDGTNLIGSKVDAPDEHKHTALSEAACGGQAAICRILLEHGANVNAVNAQHRTPLWRACFMDKRECVKLLLEHGADPRIASESHEAPESVSPADELKALLQGWDVAHTDKLLAEREKRNAKQWQPPPPDPEDRDIGEAGYFLQIALQRLADAVDSITKDSDRTILVVDLGGKAITYFEYSDCNLCCYARAAEIEPASLRKKLLGALRYGKPLVLDMLSMELDHNLIEAAFDAVMPGLFGKILTKKVLREEVYTQLINEDDGDDYKAAFFSEKALGHFQFIMISKLPVPPEWCAEGFFILRVAA